MAYSFSHDIVIIGRNIAGLGASYVLGSAGYKVTIVGEKASLNGGFQLAPNGFTALEVLGLRSKIDAGASYVNSIQLKSLERSERLAEVEHDTANLYAGVSRQHILDCLTAATANLQVTIEQSRLKALDLGKEMTKARLLLETGEIITPKLIIGADGNNGLCRAAVTGYQPAKSSSPYLALRAELPASALANPFSDKVCQLWLGNGSHFVCYPFQYRKEARINAVYCVKRSNLPSNPSDWARQTFASHPVLWGFADERIRWQETDLPDCYSLPVWQRGCLTLLGDAAHQMPPHLAQGAGQIFEDLACLSDCLKVSPAKEALQKMAQIRSRAVTITMQKARQAGSVMRLDGLSAALRKKCIARSDGAPQPQQAIHP